KKNIAAFVVASLLATPAFAAGKINLSEYKTVAVQPVLSASNTRGVFEASLAAQAAGFSYANDKAGAVSAAASKGLDNSGFGFAGKAQGVDVALMIISTSLGMLPTAMKLDPAKAKAQAQQIEALLPK